MPHTPQAATAPPLPAAATSCSCAAAYCSAEGFPSSIRKCISSLPPGSSAAQTRRTCRRCPTVPMVKLAVITHISPAGVVEYATSRTITSAAPGIGKHPATRRPRINRSGRENCMPIFLACAQIRRDRQKFAATVMVKATANRPSSNSRKVVGVTGGVMNDPAKHRKNGRHGKRSPSPPTYFFPPAGAVAAGAVAGAVVGGGGDIPWTLINE